MEGPGHRIIRFGIFEADPATGELRKAGRRIHLQEQPFRLLLLLLEHPQQVVSRTELREKIWGETYVDFEEGLNTAVRKLRDALGDSAANPRFIETLPRRGYRFIAPVEVAGGETRNPEPKERSTRRPIRWLAFVGIAAALVGAGFLVRVWQLREPVWIASPPTQLTRDSGLTSEPVISQDGKLLAYSSDRAGDGNLDIWVQHTTGGEPRRLTNDPADDRQPEISPDGSTVIFRSERSVSGIYSVPTFGGEPRLIIKDGYVPRFSPDGLRIAYALGVFGSGVFYGRLHVYTPATEATQSLAPGLPVAGPSAWSPDGEFLVSVGTENWRVRPFYLWTCSAKGGPPTRMSTIPVMEDRALVGQAGTMSVAWLGNQIILSVKQGDSSNLWAGTVTPGTRQLAGELRRLTLGSGNEALPSVSSGGKLVFASQTYSSGIWEATPGKDASGAALRRITQDRAMSYRPSVSADGSKMAYVSDRTGNSEVWVKDLVSGKEAALTRTAKAEVFVTISRDGSQVAFWDGTGIYLASTNGGAPRLLCERCGRPDDWSPDGKLIVTPYGLELDAIGERDPSTSLFTRIAAHPTRNTTGPDLSPDGKWLVFHTAEDLKSPDRRVQGKRQVFIAPYTGQWMPASSWTAVTDGTALDREAKWSTDGNRIYFLSDRDGFRCIWARKLDPKTKQPLESIYPVVHLHDSHLSLLHIPNTGNVSICPVGDKLIFAMGELSGNLWMTDLRQQ